MKRVVVTGIGALSPIGNTADEMWQSMLQGKSGIGPITRFDAEPTKISFAAEVKGFDVGRYIDPKAAKRLDRFSHYAIAAATMAYQDSGLAGYDAYDHKENTATIIGSGIGGLQTIEEQIEKMVRSGPSRISPFFIPASIANMGAAHVSMELGLRGPCYTPVTACASGTDAVGNAFDLIRSGNVKIALAGGSEASITMAGIAGFANMKALYAGDDVDRASIPFDRDRSGFVMGEGAGVIVLEELEHALKRGAKIYAEVVGYGQSADAFHITSPDPQSRGAILAMERAVRSANVAPEKIGYINAHGTSTPFNDKGETFAIKQVFGEHAKDLLVSSTKSMTGHLLGAAGAIEAIAALMAVKTGDIPPTINYKEADPECDLDYVTRGTVHREIEYSMSNSLGFGGHNATIVFKKYE
ncbi:MAG: beta-ketoacyl-ACP synthase II [Peptostreptococcaceae bacterium]|nr:beta-ketoacyl-ACP synthase II [Peptostreptococcaceae bacterium]